MEKETEPVRWTLLTLPIRLAPAGEWHFCLAVYKNSGIIQLHAERETIPCLFRRSPS